MHGARGSTREGAQNVHHNPPSPPPPRSPVHRRRSCHGGRPRRPPGGAPLRHHSRDEGSRGGRTRQEQRARRFPVPRNAMPARLLPLVASWQSPRNTRGVLEPIDRIVYERNPVGEGPDSRVKHGQHRDAATTAALTSAPTAVFCAATRTTRCMCPRTSPRPSSGR